MHNNNHYQCKMNKTLTFGVDSIELSFRTIVFTQYMQRCFQSKYYYISVKLCRGFALYCFSFSFSGTGKSKFQWYFYPLETQEIVGFSVYSPSSANMQIPMYPMQEISHLHGGSFSRISQ